MCIKLASIFIILAMDDMTPDVDDSDDKDPKNPKEPEGKKLDIRARIRLQNAKRRHRHYYGKRPVNLTIIPS